MLPVVFHCAFINISVNNRLFDSDQKPFKAPVNKNDSLRESHIFMWTSVFSLIKESTRDEKK